MTGFYTLFKKEILRFWKVGFQTLTAPIISALLYQMIFSHALKNQAEAYPGVSFAAFLIPGLAMMSMAQNAFANTSSSLIQSKITGNLVFILLPPISAFSFYCAYVGASIVRGLLVGLGVLLATAYFGLTFPVAPIWTIVFAILACGVMGAFGLLAGIWAEKFDQLAAFQNFFIMPLTFLSGVFYSINGLPAFWKGVSHFNPIFYMVDGFRFGFFGHSDVSVWLSLTVVSAFYLVLSLWTCHLLRTGYKLRD
ncbi:ABC transporter permease [Neisseria sp. Ec49-e6-T10]|uniref:ABC transporter permease n=1 Tax=Neisseria sp. Ec49-e6-T10 TaxID=3140744 RepID=UPI003EB93C66